jgi:hypothetical protein
MSIGGRTARGGKANDAAGSGALVWSPCAAGTEQTAATPNATATPMTMLCTRFATLGEASHTSTYIAKFVAPLRGQRWGSLEDSG